MPSNFKVSSDIDTFLRKQTREEASEYLGLELPPVVWGQLTGTLSNQTDLQDALDLKAPIADATFTGKTTVPSADITTADFNAAGQGGEVSWNNTEKTLDLATGSENVTLQLGQEVVLYARNTSGATLSDGQVVMISGSQGNKPTIALAQANTVENARKTIGVVTQTISNNSNGFVTLLGKVRDLVLDSGTYSEGDVVYLSSTVAGGITVVEPNISVEIGHVLATSTGGNTNGVLEVQLNNEASVYGLEQSVPHNTDSVIICNDGDNIQTKYDEATALLGGTGGTLIVMSGTYDPLDIPNGGGADIIGIGNPFIDSIAELGGDPAEPTREISYKNFRCGYFELQYNSGTIEGIKSSSFFTVSENLISGIIKDVYATGDINTVDNYGTIDNVNSTGGEFFLSINFSIIKNCSAASFLTSYMLNEGTIDNCHSTGTTSYAFGGYWNSEQYGTIRNCTAKGARSFGEQSANGVTENCTAVLQGFGGTSSQIWQYIVGGGGGNGTYKNCTGGIGSFFGVNSDTTNTRVMLANYIDCTAQEQSFGHVNVVGAETIFNGTATNCTAGFRSFAGVGATGGAASVGENAIVENCTAGNFSFGSHTNAENYGKVLRCRTTQLTNPFKASGATGVVRLGLDGNYNVVNIPAIP